MDSEQSGEFVDISDPPQQEIVTEKEVLSKMESLTVAETPATTNGDSQPVNGHSEVENGVGTEQEKMQEDPRMEESVPRDEIEVEPEAVPEVVPASSPSDDNLVANEGKDEGGNQPEKEDEPLETPVHESIPEPAVVQEPVEMQPPKEEEKVVETVEVPRASDAAEPEKKEEDKVADEALTAGDKEEKKEDEKPTEAAKEKSDVTEAEVTATAAAEEAKSEVKEQEEEDPTPAPGSLAFAILEQDKTKDALKTTRTLIVLRGLPGSGKSFLASAIAEVYRDHSAILSADDHSVKPESLEGYKAFDDAIVAKCGANTSPVLVVVDDMNHTQDRLAHLGEIAKQHQLVAVFLEPRTEWSRDVAQLSKKTKRGLEKAKLEAMKKQHDEVSIPLYYGWFLFFTEQDKVREISKNFLKMLMTLESFKKHQSDFHVREGEELDLEQVYKAKGLLHCTTKFTNYGKADGAKEYAEKKVVQDSYGSVSDLSLTALFITPCTVGARVSLSDDQLQLWPDDAEKEAETVVPGASSLPPGSRAHVTLGCGEGIEAVQTGLDLLMFLILQKERQEERLVEEIDQGTLTYYGIGRWYLSLKEPISVAACFASSYKAKSTASPAKKEKKKAKCTIL